MYLEHYYDTIVRKLFLAGAIVLILTYPFFSPLLPERPAFILIGIVLLSVMAGLTNPKQRWTSLIDIAVSLFAVVYFENHAIIFVRNPSLFWIFMTDQLLVLIFIVALYFSVKTFWEMSSR
ncbi:MAG TPA: hypothetical protein VMR99_02800 [Candidatus Paceibacterota bacterium]|nr:hypothetical protein [Candidatus Paceibacterota bacterium]